MVLALATIVCFGLLGLWVWRTSSGGSNGLMLYTAIPSVLMTALLQEPIFMVVDRALGHHNVATLLIQITCILSLGCMYCLVCGALKAGGVGRWTVGRSAIVVASAITLLVVIFTSSRWPGSDMFLTKYLTTPSAVAFSSIAWVGMGWFVVIGLRAVATELHIHSSKELTFAMSVAGVGVLCVGVSTLFHFVVVAEVACGLTQAAVQSESTTTNLINAATILIAGGLSVPSASILFRNVCNNFVDMYLLWRVYPMWKRLPVERHMWVAASGPASKSDKLRRTPRGSLLRQFIEIRDMVLLFPDALTPSDQSLMNGVERRLSNHG